MSKIANVFVISPKPSRLADLVPGATALGVQVTVLFVGSRAEAGNVFGLGADVLYTFARRESVIIEDYAASLAKVIKPAGQSLVLLPSDRRSKALAAKLGVALSAPVINEAVSFAVDPASATVTVKHTVYGGLALGEEVSSAEVTVATVGAGVFETVACPNRDTSGEVREGAYLAPAAPIKLLEVRPKDSASIDLSKARRVIGVGRGFARQEDLVLAHELAAVIEAEVGCSRPIAEGEGWMERDLYIGVSGQTIKSDLYWALGVSGQIQHMVGANGSKTIVAVNKDKNAPIFKYADYGIVGDLYKVLPAVTKALRG